MEAASAETVAASAEDAWRTLAVPLGLPDRFSSPVFVRLVPIAEWREMAPFRVVVEVGGVVSVRVGWSEQTPNYFLRRGLVQALLLRLAVTQHGVTDKLAAPLWLELGSVGWWQTHAEPATFDALKQESDRFDPPALSELLDARRGDVEARSLTVGAEWLLAWLQTESGNASEWPGMLRGLLGGGEGSKTLAASFPGRFATDADRELWWQTGWHHLRRVRSLPTLEAAESRDELASVARFVFAVDGREAVIPLSTVLAHAHEPMVDAELRRREVDLNRLSRTLHPFYRNAGLSLGEALGSRGVSDGARGVLVAAFERDWRDAGELEAATHAALDKLERRGLAP